MAHEDFLAFFQRDGVDNALALSTFQAGKNDIPLAGVNHYRHLRDVGLGLYKIEEDGHLAGGIEQSVVHINIDDQGAVVHLLPCYLKGLVVVLLFYKTQELTAAGNVTTLANIYKRYLGSEFQFLQTAQHYVIASFRNNMRGLVFSQLDVLRDKLVGCAATSAYDIHQPLVDEAGYFTRHALRCLIVKT